MGLGDGAVVVLGGRVVLGATGRVALTALRAKVGGAGCKETPGEGDGEGEPADETGAGPATQVGDRSERCRAIDPPMTVTTISNAATATAAGSATGRAGFAGAGASSSAVTQ